VRGEAKLLLRHGFSRGGKREREREMMRLRETAAKWKSKSTTGHRQRGEDSKSYYGNRKWQRQSVKRRGREEGDWGHPGRQPRQTE